MPATIRRARTDDEPVLRRLAAATNDPSTSPAPPPPAFFTEHRPPDDVLVAVADDAVCGYVRLDQRVPLPSHRHVLELNGLAVAPPWQGAGVGRRLVLAALQEARHRGARKVGLRVLAGNTGARRLYERCGFEVEGTLRAEFLLDGTYVDEILMAHHRRP